MRGMTRQRAAVFALLAAWVVAPAPVFAQTSDADEYEVKAAMLVNVLKLVDWPASKATDTPALSICVVSSGDMEGALEHAVARASAGKSLTGRPMAVKKLAGIAGIAQCQAVFIGGSDKKRTQAAIQATGAQPILTVGESDSFTGSGGMIGLLANGDHVQVEVNLPVVQAAGLSVSSRLLRIATVRGGGTQ